MAPSVAAGSVYAFLTFLAGFALGTLRVLLVAPRLGATAAVSLEVPVILFASWQLSRWCTRRFGVREAVGPRVLMGTVAFVILMAAEIGVSVFVFRRSPADHFAGYRSLSGVLGLAAQLAFATFPFLQGRSAAAVR